jgi:hypothetical protein
MYRDNGLGAATRVQNSHLYRIDKIRKFEEDKIVNEQDIKEKERLHSIITGNLTVSLIN